MAQNELKLKLDVTIFCTQTISKRAHYPKLKQTWNIFLQYHLKLVMCKTWRGPPIHTYQLCGSIALWQREGDNKRVMGVYWDGVMKWMVDWWKDENGIGKGTLLKNGWWKVDEDNEKMFKHKKLHYKGRLEQGGRGGACHKWTWGVTLTTYCNFKVDPFCFCHTSYHV